MISGVYAPCTGFPFFRFGPLSSSTASRVEIPPEFLQASVPEASCGLPFWFCSNPFSTFIHSKQFLSAATIVSMVICPPARHELSRHPLTRQSPRSITTVTVPRFLNDLGAVEDRSAGDAAFQPIRHRGKKEFPPKKTKKKPPCVGMLLSEASSLCCLDLAERSICARNGSGNWHAGEYHRGICIILHIQSGSALSAAA